MMKRASRSLKAWKKLFATLEREPLALILILLMIVDAMCEGAWGESLSYAINTNGFLREQDVFQAVVSDFFDLGSRVVQSLGDPLRGESVKTGVDQGVEYTEGWIVKMLRAYRRRRKKSDRMFSFSSKRYNRGFQQRLKKFGARPQRGVYVLRHSGAANYVARALREEKEEVNAVLEKGRRRGRWANLKSMQVYTKTHLLARSIASLRPDVLRRGAYLLDNLDLLADVWVERFFEAGEQENSHSYWSRDMRLRPPPGYEIPDDYVVWSFGVADDDDADGGGSSPDTDSE